MLISVVTVCKNARESIGETLNSVLVQIFTDYEYIVVDGNSEDGTSAVLKCYEPKFADKKIKFRIIEEVDSGIYNAMNNAECFCNGTYLIYMNAGDRFASNRTLLEAADIIGQHTNVGVFYGDYYKRHNENRCERLVLCKARELGTIRQNMPFCHQASFTNTAMIRKYKFNERYKVAADYDMFLRMYLKEETFFYVNIPVAVFSLDGITNKNQSRLQIEYMIIHFANKTITIGMVLNDLKFWVKYACHRIRHKSELGE